MSGRTRLWPGRRPSPRASYGRLLGLVGPDMADRALRAADRVGAVDLDSVERDRRWTAVEAKGSRAPLVAGLVRRQSANRGPEGLGPGPMCPSRRSRMELSQGILVEGLAIGASGLFLHAALEVQQGGLGGSVVQGAGGGVGICSACRAGSGIRAAEAIWRNLLRRDSRTGRGPHLMFQGGDRVQLLAPHSAAASPQRSLNLELLGKDWQDTPPIEGARLRQFPENAARNSGRPRQACCPQDRTSELLTRGHHQDDNEETHRAADSAGAVRYLLEFSRQPVGTLVVRSWAVLMKGLGPVLGRLGREALRIGGE